jgi:hypothetical protein
MYLMKPFLTYFFTLLMSVGFLACGQGTFIYDQQSADESAGGGGAQGIQAYQPIGQSFKPALSLVGFVRLQLFDVNSGNSNGATVHVNLRSNSVTGPVLASTDAVFMPDGFGVGNGNRGYTNFLFSTPAPVTPGVTYYLQPVVQSGDAWAIVSYNYGYPGGSIFLQGATIPGIDLWFREGIVVPEPSSGLLFLFGSGAVAWRHRRRRG